MSAALPADVEIEAALLGAILIENRLLDDAADLLRPDDFSNPIHSRIFFHAICEHAKGRRVDPLTLRRFFEAEDDPIKDLGGAVYINRLTADGMGLYAPHQLMQDIADLSQRRRIMAGLEQSLKDCQDMTLSIAEIAAGAEAAITPENDKSLDERDAYEFGDAFIADYDLPNDGVECHSIPELDRLLGKLKPKSFTVMAARPGMGKTATAVSYAIGAAQAGHGVLFISLEMSGKELAGRMISDVCFDPPLSVPYNAIRDGRLGMTDKQAVDDARAELRKLPLRVVDVAGLPISRLAGIVRRNVRRFEARGQKLELVIVDYLQLIQSDNKSDKRYEVITNVSMGLKGIAKANDLAVMALAQLSREVEKRPDKRPQLSDLRESGQIEQDADMVLFLLRTEYYLKQEEPERHEAGRQKWEDSLELVKGKIDFILAKRRNGTTGSAKGEFHGAFQAVR